MQRIRPILAISALCILSTAAPALAGVVFEIETKDHPASDPETTEVMAEGKNLKMSISSRQGRGQDGEVIYRGERREVVIVDHRDKSYMVVDQQALDSILGQVSSAMSQLDKALEGVPEEQRAMVEKMLRERMPNATKGGASAPRPELRRTAERATHGGYASTKYEILQGGRKQREMWITDWSNIEGGREVAAVFADMAGFFTELMEAVQQAAREAGGAAFIGGLADNPMTFLAEVDGFPVVTRGFDRNGSLEDESTLRSASRRTLDPADFEPPAGYERRTMGP